MIKKRLFSCILPILMCVSLSACGSNRNDIVNGQSESYSNSYVNTELSEAEAKQVAAEYVNGVGRSELERNLSNACGASSISNLSFASFESGGGMVQDYCFTIKGNFYSLDEYGKVKDHNGFSWCVGVTKSGNVTIASNGLIN